MTITANTIQTPPVLTRSPTVTLTTPHWAGSSATLNRGAGELLAVNKCQPDLHGNHLVRLLLAAYNSILKQFSSPNGRRGLFSSAPGRWGIVLRAGSPTLCCCSHYERAKSKNSSCLWKVVIITARAVWSVCMYARLGKHCRARGGPTIKHGVSHVLFRDSGVFASWAFVLLVERKRLPAWAALLGGTAPEALMGHLDVKRQKCRKSPASRSVRHRYHAELAFQANRHCRLSLEWWEVAVERGCNGRFGCRPLPVILSYSVSQKFHAKTIINPAQTAVLVSFLLLLLETEETLRDQVWLLHLAYIGAL